MFDPWFVLAFMFGLIVVLLSMGIPVVFSFIVTNFVGSIMFLGGEVGIIQALRNLRVGAPQYSLVPIPLFVLMGEIMLHSGMAKRAIDAIDRLIASIPGRLSIVAVLAGTIFATLSGSSVANAAVVGRTLIPEMRKKGYSSLMTIGPVTAVGGIAVLIPPSAMAVMVGSLGRIPLNELLLSGIVPALLMMLFYLAYIVIRCTINPSLAPRYDTEKLTLRERLAPALIYVLPLGGIFVAVIGSMMAGIATPTEASALGVIASAIAGLLYRSLNGKVLVDSLVGTVKFSAMILFIICNAATFSQILAFTGATQAVTNFFVQGDVSHMTVVWVMLGFFIVLGCFMESAAIVMLLFPVFMPVVYAMGIDLVWLGILVMVALELGLLTPPFGMLLFVVKGILGNQYTDFEIYKSVLPFIVMQVVVLLLILFNPGILHWVLGLIQ